ncbi:hypothetical protein IPJ72_01830 [Candidatus Peregrinibacteria bacterium]|nr:MAG: hypothetical protein IPJ72_01830 [Candidatus Peregrinibacteria bacterium]
MSLYTIEHNPEDDTLTGRRGNVCETITVGDRPMDEATEALRRKMMQAFSAASYLRLVTEPDALDDGFGEENRRALENLHRNQ